MKLSQHYIRLQSHFSEVDQTDEIAVTVDELAEILDCTHRNVMLLLGRMCELNWLEWKPKRGRGNRSGLVLLVPPEELILDLAKQLIEKKDLRGALEQMSEATVSPAIKEQFNQWLYGYFGYKTEVKNDRKLDILRFPLSGPLESLDPLHTNFASESHLVKQIFDSLVHYNALTQKIEPHLAHHWEVDDSRTQWTFYLRKGVLFHHGQEMSADDVIYSLTRPMQLKGKTLFGWVYSQVKQIEKINPTAIRIHLAHPNELFLPFLSTNRAVIVPKEVCEQSPGTFGKSPIGTGPFKLIRNDRSMCVIEAFPHYFQERAHLDRVEIWNIPGLYEQERGNQLESFQITHNVNWSDKENGALKQVKESGVSCKFITFNSLKSGPLQNHKLRQALCEILDSDLIVQQLNADEISISTGFLMKTDIISKLPEDKIKNILKEEKKQDVPLELCTISHYEKDAQLVKTLCQKAGLDIHISLLSPEEFKSDKRLHADMILFALLLDNDMELRLIDLYRSMQLHLDPALGTLVEEKISLILSEPSLSGRNTIFQEIELLLREKYWIHFLYQKQQRTLYDTSIKGISLDSLSWVQFKEIWF